MKVELRRRHCSGHLTAQLLGDDVIGRAVIRSNERDSNKTAVWWHRTKTVRVYSGQSSFGDDRPVLQNYFFQVSGGRVGRLQRRSDRHGVLDLKLAFIELRQEVAREHR